MRFLGPSKDISADNFYGSRGTELDTVRIYLVIKTFDRIALFRIHYDCFLSEKVNEVWIN